MKRPMMRIRARVPITMPAMTPERVLGVVPGMEVPLTVPSIDLSDRSVMLDRVRGETYEEGEGALLEMIVSTRL
jgi:hypothetical protein